ncbi:aldo/keto reductase [Mycolicibacterium sediminis]|uniref:Aldo/keto reductase n=1 Tax=Mycolicibacterium sediminis TaxID=1286180 RepID=A0A7I7QLK9_9MYCO|nr:aldo/keto reductase [Mycolicibacterium sediminis]BBY26766.1 aldo/keto reductase [Mycolicibacterium sediminis]
MTLDQYYLLGRSGLRVSRLSLGTMNFGTSGYHAAYGKGIDDVRPIFRRYVEAGGNVVDTADFYTAGESETILGTLIAETRVRDRLVLTTKFTNSVSPGDPNAGGNGRKHMVRALEDSLRRLGTDYVDLYLLHTWDRLTPVEEVMRTFDDLVRAGKIRYAGFSDVPSWYAAQGQTFAVANGLAPVVNLQLPYSLVERTIETEHVDMGRTLGMGISAWSPLAGGFLSGKYRADGAGLAGDGRLARDGAAGSVRSEREWRVLASLAKVADDLGVTMAQVAINWVATQPGIASAVIGASSVAQLDATIAALDVELPAGSRAELDEASAVPPESLYRMFTADYQHQLVSPGVEVADHPAGYAPGVRNW